MNVKGAHLVCAKLLRQKARQNPDGVITVEGKKFKYLEAAEELERMCEWVCPTLDTECIKKIVLCKSCKHYKRYRKKGAVWPVVKTLCELDKVERRPDYFCGNGIEKED